MGHLRKEIEEYRVDRLLDFSRVLLKSLEHPKTMAEISCKENRTTILAFLLEMLRFGFFRGHLLDIYKYRVHCLNLQIECIDRQSTSSFSTVIRQHLYSILLRETSNEASNQDGVELTEFQRSEQDYVRKTIKITPYSQTLFDLLDQSTDDRRLFILRIIQLADQFEAINEISRTVKGSMLFLLALKHFNQKCNVSVYQLEAFLIMHIFCKREKTIVFPEEPDLDFSLLHQFSSFHSVLYHFSMLNTLLGNPFDAMTTRHLLSGSKFLHIIQKKLLKGAFHFYLFRFFIQSLCFLYLSESRYIV